MTRFFTADLHLGHANIITYTHRPFPDVGAMDRALVANWNATVGPDDEIWVLGDVALGRIANSLALVADLQGRKILVAGNHDRCWAGHRKGVEAWTQRYLDAGFAEVHQGTVALDLDGRPALACHFPYRGDSHGEDRHLAFRPHDDGVTPLLHGHVHDAWKADGRMVNVGVDVWGMAPVSESRVAAALALDEAPLDR